MEKKYTAKKLTAEEKLRLLCGDGAWHTADLAGKLPKLRVSDGPVGLRTERMNEEGESETIPAVAYPSIQILANTWNLSRAKDMGEALADDCKERGVDILLAPGVNIKRDPRNGRNFEYFSEDPVLAGSMAKRYIEGVQGKGIGVCLKHFCCNNLEYDRLHQSSDVDERTMREIYYLPFEIACEAKPVSVMCSYNRVNGVYAAENKKGFDLLRNEFGFDGAVISDWGAVRDRTASAIAGLDLEMAFSQENYDKLCADHAAGALPDEVLDACADRMLHLIYRCKEMQAGEFEVSSVASRARTAKKVAAEGMVLLKNEELLPLHGVKKISLAGCFAKPESADMLRGGGSAAVEWLDKKFDLEEALTARGYQVLYESAFRYQTINSFGQSARPALENAAVSDVNIVCVGTGSPVEYESGDRSTLRLPDVQERAIIETAEENPNTVVVIFAGAAIDVSAWEEKVKAILYAGFPGMGGDEVIADILTGKICPSGKLSETFPLDIADVPAANAWRSAGVTRYQEGLDVGYRYFDTYGVPVAYPFGFGLSYAFFAYDDLKLEGKGSALKVTYEVENTSEIDGKEISQVYVRECAPLVYRPYKELKGFSKDKVKAGKRVKVSLTLDSRAFAHWSTAFDRWTVTDGVYEILVGASSEDIRLRAKIKIKNGEIEVL